MGARLVARWCEQQKGLGSMTVPQMRRTQTRPATRLIHKNKRPSRFNAQVLAMREKDAECSACGREDTWYEQLEGWWELSNDGVRFSPAA